MNTPNIINSLRCFSCIFNAERKKQNNDCISITDIIQNVSCCIRHVKLPEQEVYADVAVSVRLRVIYIASSMCEVSLVY